MNAIKPEVVCVCCCAGSDEYTDNEANKFPTQQFINNIAPYTDKVYVTTISTNDEDKYFESLNGDITVFLGKDGVNVICSASDLKLKETDWFKENRTTPDACK